MKQKKENRTTSKFAALWGLLRTFMVAYCVPGKRFRLKRLYQQFITEGMLCFDIGSHYGNRIPVWSQLGASVVAVEPQPILYKFLVQNYAKRKNVRLLQAVISDQDGEQTLFHNIRNPSLSSIDKAWIVEKKEDPIWGNYQWDAEIQVKAYTLDQLIEAHGIPDFCKIDVEGAEYKVLAGLSIPLNCISFEYLTIDKERTLACIERLEALGLYRYNWTISEKGKLMSSTWLTAKNMKNVVQNMDGTYSGDIYAQYHLK
jgi:FkbM family methyltransferase